MKLSKIKKFCEKNVIKNPNPERPDKDKNGIELDYANYLDLKNNLPKRGEGSGKIINQYLHK